MRVVLAERRLRALTRSAQRRRTATAPNRRKVVDSTPEEGPLLRSSTTGRRVAKDHWAALLKVRMPRAIRLQQNDTAPTTSRCRPCYSRSTSRRMGLLACRGPVHAPSLVWAAGGSAVDPPSLASPRPPSGRRPQNSSAAGAQRRYYDVTYDPARSASSGLGGNPASKRAHTALSVPVSSAPPAQHHRLKVVSGESHFRSEKHEILQGPHAAGGDPSLYAPVYFRVPGFPAQESGGMDKWDSARVLHRSRPVAAVLRHIGEHRCPLSPGELKTRYVPLFDQQGRPVHAAPLAPPHVPESHRARGRGITGEDAGGNAQLARKSARSSSSYMYCISNNLGHGMDGSAGSNPAEGSGSFRAPLSAPALIGYKPVYIGDYPARSHGADSSGSTREHTNSRSYERGGAHSRHPRPFESNHSAFLVSCSGREGRSYRTVAGSHCGPYGGASGRAHCRALYSSQTGYTLGWVRRRNADEHAAAAKIQAWFRGR